MRLTPTEMDRLTIFTAAELARKRRARGLRLNHPEALALICDEMHEAARDGRSYEDVVATGSSILSEDDLLDGVADLLSPLRLECLFADGSRVIWIDQPVQRAAWTSASE